MATFSHAEDIISCAICCERYRDPRILPCAHQFCLTCLVKTFGRGRTISCPLCRKLTVLGPWRGGPQTLPKPIVMNHAQEYIERTLQSSQQADCSVCTTPGKGATNYCYDCQDRLCSACFKDHEKSMADHKVVIFNSSLFCDDHEEPLILFCTGCDESICKRCVRQGHKGHDTESLTEKAELSRSAIKRHMEKYLAEEEQMQGKLKQAISRGKIAIKRTGEDLDEAISVLKHTLEILGDAKDELRWRAETSVSRMEEAAVDFNNERQKNEDQGKYLLERAPEPEVVEETGIFRQEMKAIRDRPNHWLNLVEVIPKMPQHVKNMLCPRDIVGRLKPRWCDGVYFSPLVEDKIISFEEREVQLTKPKEPPRKRRKINNHLKGEC